MPRPDAVLVPDSLKVGKKSSDRMASVLKLVEPILEVDRTKGEKGWIRHLVPPYPAGTGNFPGSPRLVMVTRDSDAGRDTLLFHHTHESALEHRYTWGPVTEQGVSIGTLVEGANDVAAD